MKDMVLNNGVHMPVFGLGTWDLRGPECTRVVQEAIGLGYRLIDTAQMYGNEHEVGEGIRRCGVSRGELFITTKIYSPDTGYKKAKKAVERSLENLGLDYIDLLLIHEPYATSREMYGALKEAYAAGKLRAIGISNFNESRYLSFVRDCGIIPAVNQVESHVYFPQMRLQKTLESHGTKMQAWAPFTEGRRDIFNEPALKAIGGKHGKSSAQVALRYLIQNGIAAIAKSSKVQRLKENMELFDFTLDGSDMKEIAGMDGGKSLFGWY